MNTIDRLKQYMTDNGLEQKDIAKKLGVTQQSVSLWFHGAIPRQNRLDQIEAMMAGRGSAAAPLVKASNGISATIKDTLAQHADRKLADDLEEEFVLALPEELARNTMSVVQHRGLPWKCDYRSPKLCLQLVLSTSLGLLVEPHLLRLAAIKAIHASEPSEKYMLIVIGGEKDTDRRLDAICDILGISYMHVLDSVGAAALVADIEYGPM